MVFSFDSLITILIGAASSGLALFIIEQWKKRSGLVDRVIRLEQDALHLKELIQEFNEKIRNQEHTLQEFSRQVSSNSALLKVHSKATDSEVSPTQNAS